MVKDAIEITEKRREIYEFLSYFYLNVPSEELLNLVKENSKNLNELTKDSLEFMENKNLDDFIQEYYDRFFVPTSKLFIPPHESAIIGRKKKNNKLIYGKLDSQETFHVKACYELVDFKVDKLEGFRPVMDNHYPDHIAFELSFLTYLVNLECEMLKKGKEKEAEKWKKLQKDFLEGHLSKWIKDYSQLVKEKGIGLYSYIASVVAGWIDLDFQHLKEEVI